MLNIIQYNYFVIFTKTICQMIISQCSGWIIKGKRLSLSISICSALTATDLHLDCKCVKFSVRSSLACVRFSYDSMRQAFNTKWLITLANYRPHYAHTNANESHTWFWIPQRMYNLHKHSRISSANFCGMKYWQISRGPIRRRHANNWYSANNMLFGK